MKKERKQTLTKEIEVKIINISEKEILTRLNKLGAKKVKDVFQRNQYFKIDGQKSKRTIRIREEKDNEDSTKNNKSFLTIKTKMSKIEGISSRDEFEREIDNPKQMREIFLAMGLVKKRCYEMKRKYFRLDECSVEIVHAATVPTYLEIEGDKEKILLVARKLGFTKNDFLQESMIATYPQLKGDVRFENEKN